jgi:hypothetical protein
MPARFRTRSSRFRCCPSERVTHDVWAEVLVSVPGCDDRTTDVSSSSSRNEVLDAHARARSVADHIVPLYNPEVFDRYPDGLVAPP